MPHEIGSLDLSVRAAELRVVDVREATEFDGQLGHVPGAELVPLSELARRAMSWNRGQPVAVVCRSGGLRSGRAVAMLSRMGFEAMKLKGGMERYVASGLARERFGQPLIPEPKPAKKARPRPVESSGVQTK